ncbi:MAG: MarR family winged helix-turn-helix transcriptional regulator [Tannerella sp.]|nr:MarR family winged helix-turn-helix transcriptional regulator [Tannerella sp.]
MQYAILASICWLVYHTDSYVTQSILAQHTKVNPMTVSQIFKVLESKGLIYRQQHPTDIRAKIVNLTDEGNKLMHKAFKTIWDVDEKFFRILEQDEKYFNSLLYELIKSNN